MIYQNAFQQSTSCVASIRCTYASIFDSDGNRLFTFQKEKFPGDICWMTKYVAAPDANTLVPVRVTTEAATVLAEYLDNVIGKRYEKKNVRGIRDIWFQKPSNGWVWVNPQSLDWKPVPAAEEINSKALLLVSAALLLFNN